MTPRNYLYLLKKYDEYQPQIDRLLESIVTTLAPNKIASSPEELGQVVDKLYKSYPFVELLYCLDEQGMQTTDSAAAAGIADSKRREAGLGSDRSNRVYYSAARDNHRDYRQSIPPSRVQSHHPTRDQIHRYHC